MMDMTHAHMMDMTQVEVEEYQAYARTLYVSFESYSPHSYPALYVRRGSVPALWEVTCLCLRCSLRCLRWCLRRCLRWCGLGWCLRWCGLVVCAVAWC